jgi:hypothetical protein
MIKSLNHYSGCWDEGEPRLANCGTSLTMDKDSSEGKPRMDYYPKIHIDVYVMG